MFRSKKLSAVKGDATAAVFKAATTYAKQHPELSGSDKVKLQLYGLFKVATKGKMPEDAKAPSKLALVAKARRTAAVVYVFVLPLCYYPSRRAGPA